MNLTTETVRGLREFLATTHGLTYADPRDPGVALLRNVATLGARAGVSFLGTLVGVPQSMLDSAMLDLSHTSVALGKLILLSEAAVADPLEELDTVVHECQHGIDAGRSGIVQAGIDYTVSELRAHREARAYVAGRFVRYLVTGEELTPEEVSRSLAAGPYHLAPEDLPFAQGVARSHVETIRSGVCPPITAAVDALAWLRQRAPEVIRAEAWQ